MAPEFGVERLPWLFTGTFLFTLVTVPGFGWVAKHVRRSWLIPSVYSVLITNLLVFYALLPCISCSSRQLRSSSG